jgi:acyl-coenzyme A thioesterase PaaI-like protein
MSTLQDLYPDDFAHCYGCGRLNVDGLHVRSEWRDGEAPRFVTASLHVDFLRPTPLGPELVLHARALEVGERKVAVEVHVSAGDAECARARVVAVRAPATMVRESA